MKNLVYSILIVSGLILFGSCGSNPQPGSERLLEQAEKLVEKYPDSAMMLLDSLFYPEKSLKHEPYMRFLVTQVQVKYKTFRPIDQDTLIFQARDYFSGHDKKPRISALAWFYSGCVHRERKDYDNAMQHYRTAMEYAAQTGDSKLQGLIQYNIGDLMVAQDLYTKGLEYYKAASQYYSGYPKENAYSLCAIGRMYLLSNNPDSAFYYFQKGQNAAKRTNDEVLESVLAQNIGVAYQETGKYSEAETYFRQSIHYNQDKMNQPRYYLIFAKLFTQMENKDSVAYYTGKLKDCIDASDNNYVKASAYEFLAEREIVMGNHNDAFDYLNNRINSLNRIMDERKNQSVYEIEQKYNIEQQLNHYNLKFIRFQRWLIGLLEFSLIIAVALVFFHLRYVKEKKDKQKIQENAYSLQKTMEDLLTIEMGNNQKIQENVNVLQKTTNDLLSSEKEKKLALEMALEWRLDVLKKTIQLNYGMNENDKKIHQSILEKMDLILFDTKKPGKVICQTVENLYPELQHLITQQFSGLLETEYNVCLLTYIGMSVQEVAYTLDLSDNAIYKIRCDLNKKAGSNFYSILREKYK